ncbi:MAG TPA: phosphoesterase, partial [Planctomycetaceae bacterium]|nr:phosphoesterase [Planctomycetaceae bacterium]
KRGKLQGEGRLHSKRSVGVGGHISSHDQNLFGSVYLEAMHREIGEEVYLETTYRDTCVGLLNDDETEVGKVHLGIVHIFDLDAPKVRPREKSMLQSGFASSDELVRELDQFESWSQLCLAHLFAKR